MTSTGPAKGWYRNSADMQRADSRNSAGNSLGNESSLETFGVLPSIEMVNLDPFESLGPPRDQEVAPQGSASVEAQPALVSERSKVSRDSKGRGNVESQASPFFEKAKANGESRGSQHKDCQSKRLRRRSSLLRLGRHPEIERIGEMMGVHAQNPAQFRIYLRNQVSILESTIQNEYDILWEASRDSESFQRTSVKTAAREQDEKTYRRKRQSANQAVEGSPRAQRTSRNSKGSNVDTSFSHGFYPEEVPHDALFGCTGVPSQPLADSKCASHENSLRSRTEVATSGCAQPETQSLAIAQANPPNLMTLQPPKNLPDVVSTTSSLVTPPPTGVSGELADFDELPNRTTVGEPVVFDDLANRKTLECAPAIPLPSPSSALRSDTRSTTAGSATIPLRSTKKNTTIEESPDIIMTEVLTRTQQRSLRGSEGTLVEQDVEKSSLGHSETDGYFSLWAAWERASVHSLSKRHESYRSSSRDTEHKKSISPYTTVVNDDDSDSDNSDDARKVSAHSAAARDNKILHPLSPMRFIWDVLTSFLVAYECFIGPLQLFDIPEHIFLTTMKWILRVFWTLDLPLNFITGYQTSPGHTEMRFCPIVKHYMKRWFLFDFTLVTIDWLEDFLKGAAGATTSRPILKTLRMLRVIRLLRFLKVAVIQRRTSSVIMVAIQFHLKSEMFQIWMSLLKIIFLMLWGNHMLACVWYALGNANGDGHGKTWKSIIEEYGHGNSITYMYIASYHWSLSNFHGSMEVHPVTLAERVYAVMVMFVAFILAAWVISSVTSAMTRLSLAGVHRSDKLMSLKQFLVDNNVSRRMIVRIERNVQRRLETQEHERTEDDIELLSNVSHSVRVDLSFEIYMPLLACHPFLREYQVDSAVVMKEICHGAVKRVQAVRGEYLFYEDEMAPVPRMYFVRSGKLRYTQAGDVSPGTKIGAGNWFCEQSLWTPWSHCGTIRVSSGSASLLTLDSEKFIQIASRSAQNKRPCYAFGREYIQLLNQVSDEDLTDLAVPGIDLEATVKATFRGMVKPHGPHEPLFQRALSLSARALTQAFDQ